MNERISVGASFNNGWFIGTIVLAAICLIVGLALLPFHLEPGLVLVVIGGVFGFIATFQGLSIAKGRKWFTATADGFTYEDKRGAFDFADDDIVELGTWAKTRLSNGIPKTIARECRIVLEAGEYRGDLKFSYTFPIEKLDPQTEFLERNLQRLSDLAVERIAKGEPLVGDDWEYDRNELQFREGRQSRTHATDELVAADVVDNKVCVWVRGEPKPAVKIPAEGLNALVLLRVLAKRFQDQGAKEDDEPGLGRIIFERDHSIPKGTLVLTFILCGAMLAGSVVAAIFAAKERDPTGPGILAGVLALLGIGIGLAVWLNRTNILRCHTKGVCRITTKTTKELEYKDIRVFSYGAIRQYYNGSYTGTTVTMNFEPAPESESDPIKYSATMKKVDGELDNLRDHVSNVVASQMNLRLQNGQSVKWTEGMTFTPDGLQVDIAGGILSKAKSRKISYYNCLFSLNEGYFFLFKRGGKDAIYSLPVSASNFFPGFMLINQLSYEANQKAEAAKAEPTAEETTEE
jgi:hypothetical protein